MAGLFVLLLALGLLLWLLPWLAVVAAVVAPVWALCRWMVRDGERYWARRAADRATAARADQQNAWWHAGDPRGTYGDRSER